MKSNLVVPLRKLRICGLFLVLALTAAAQIPSPKDVLGFTPGDDRKLASWAQVVEYFKKLDAASDRVKFEEIGTSTMGAPTISSPENLRNLEKYKRINARLADPRTFKSNDKVAGALVKQGKTIVLITCGVHSTEVGSYLSSLLIAHRLASSSEPEVKTILDNTIVLLVPALNPDGVDIVKNWYDKTLGTPYEGTDPPELYHKYVGHDDNRDWYAFTQVETQLTVDKIHNVWHPQIVHDIHQQGAYGSRLFLPPYMQPVEPNVPKQIVEGYTELGNYIASQMRSAGYQGITTNSTYDAWTPSRAYSHYHGGVRILSETASAKLATPITVKFDELRPGEGYDPKKVTDNFGPLWLGGEWHLRNITDTMTTAAFALMNHAANNREEWLSRFYQIGKDAVRPRKAGELRALGIKWDGSWEIEDLLDRARVEHSETSMQNIGRKSQDPEGVIIINMAQPYSMFAKAILEDQTYPNLRNADGSPIPPYDVTAHSISRLFDLEVVPIKERIGKRYSFGHSGPDYGGCLGGNQKVNHVSIYRSFIPAIDEGWTRFVFERSWFPYGKECEKLDISQLTNRNITKPISSSVIVFPDQSPNQMLNGHAKGTMPDEYTGGVGTEGVANLKKFVDAGGTLVFLNHASDFAIEQFNLPIHDVTKGLARKDFYIPGSILRTELDTAHPIAKGMPAESIAWFENGPAFEVQTDPLALANNFRIIARYPSDPSKILLSGWALGAEKIAGKAALVEVTVGKGKIILFGFRPQYRGQSLATFPLLFNAISQ
jgi:hypothetical protein